MRAGAGRRHRSRRTRSPFRDAPVELPLDDVTALVSTQASRHQPRFRRDGQRDRVGTLKRHGPCRRRRAAAAALSAFRSPQRRRRGVWPARRAVGGVARWRHTRRRATGRRLHREPAFALVGGIAGGGLDATAIAAVEPRNVRSRAPHRRRHSLTIARTTFYLLSGVEQQARALIDFEAARSGTGGTTAAIVRSRALVPDGVPAASPQPAAMRAGTCDS